jgi:hypothetical protein
MPLGSEDSRDEKMRYTQNSRKADQGQHDNHYASPHNESRFSIFTQRMLYASFSNKMLEAAGLTVRLLFPCKAAGLRDAINAKANPLTKSNYTRIRTFFYYQVRNLSLV